MLMFLVNKKHWSSKSDISLDDVKTHKETRQIEKSIIGVLPRGPIVSAHDEKNTTNA